MLSIRAVLPWPVLLHTTGIQTRRRTGIGRTAWIENSLERKHNQETRYWGFTGPRQQFELKSSLARKHNEKDEVFSSLLLFHQHSNNTRYLWSITLKSVTQFFNDLSSFAWNLFSKKYKSKYMNTHIFERSTAQSFPREKQITHAHIFASTRAMHSLTITPEFCSSHLSQTLFNIVFSLLFWKKFRQ